MSDEHLYHSFETPFQISQPCVQTTIQHPFLTLQNLLPLRMCMPSAASLMTENPTAVHFLHPPSSLPMGNNLSDLPSPSSHVREIQKLLLPLMLAQEKKQGLKIEVFVPVAIEIIKKDNLSFREQTIQDQLGRQATSVQTDMKKVKAAVSLYVFV